MKAMSIIGIVWFSLSILFIIGFNNNANDEAVGWGILGMLYAIPYAIAGLVFSYKKPKVRSRDITAELAKLGELKEKGILTEEEFTNRKNKLLDYD